MDTRLEIFFFVLTALAILLGIFWAISTEKRLKRFFRGAKGRDLEETIAELEKNITKLERARNSTEQEIAGINKKLQKSIRGLETLRFNPFPDQGGNQSFAIGMLDEEGDGLVLSSLYSRDRMSVFAKPVKNHTSTYELTNEEREVLTKAKVS